MAHELGHWKKSHITNMVVFNTFYMLLFGLIMIPTIDNRYFLAAFSIQMESYFMTLVLFTLLYLRSVDIPIRILINYISRRNEHEADEYAVELGFGREASTALIRNFSQNKDIIFDSKIENFTSGTHPQFLNRLSKIKRETQIAEQNGVKPAPELALKVPEVSKNGAPPPPEVAHATIPSKIGLIESAVCPPINESKLLKPSSDDDDDGADQKLS